MSATLASAPSATIAAKPRTSFGVVAHVQAFFRRLDTERELHSLSDRELADIGLSRSDIRNLVRGIGPFATASAFRSF